MAPDYVLCFDRDYTVDVNPHPERRAVPLAWVKYWAHDSDFIDVWATGNQHLRYEAAIPGVSRAKETRDKHLGYGDGETDEGYHPSRRETLRLVADVYHPIRDSVEFIVVDDVNLGDMQSEGWTHYFPWEFVEAVQTGTAPVEVPDECGFSDIPANSDSCPERLETAEHYNPTTHNT